LNLIAVAMHKYANAHMQRFPAHDSDGTWVESPNNGLSWRVHLLPYISEDFKAVYDKFHLDEPWDSEHNKSLITKMPRIFGDDPEGKSLIHVVIDALSEKDPSKKLASFRPNPPRAGDDEPHLGPAFGDITDGFSSTIMLVQSGINKAAPWTQPGGLSCVASDPVEGIGNAGDSFYVAMFDGKIFHYPTSIDPKTLWHLIGNRDSQIVDQEEFAIPESK